MKTNGLAGNCWRQGGCEESEKIERKSLAKIRLLWKLQLGAEEKTQGERRKKFPMKIHSNRVQSSLAGIRRSRSTRRNVTRAISFTFSSLLTASDVQNFTFCLARKYYEKSNASEGNCSTFADARAWCVSIRAVIHCSSRPWLARKKRFVISLNELRFSAAMFQRWFIGLKFDPKQKLRRFQLRISWE